MCVNNKQATEKGKVGQESFRGKTSHRTMLLRAAVALPDLSPPPDCFQLVLEPWAFRVLEAGPDPTIPPAPHPAA